MSSPTPDDAWSSLSASGAAEIVADPPMTDAESRRGVWVRYRTNDEAVTELYLRLGLAICEFAD